MKRLPDEAIVVRGGQNSPESFRKGSGVSLDKTDKLVNVSVNSGVGLSVERLAAPDKHTGYPGLPHHQLGVTTVGEVRLAGGDVDSSPTRTNPLHSTLSGITAEQASQLFRPTVANPHKQHA
jgi:hypothetical protein